MTTPVEASDALLRAGSYVAGVLPLLLLAALGGVVRSMILLHHPESELSRALLAALPEGATPLDCSQGLPADYTGPQPSAFPSVVVDVPAYMSVTSNGKS